MAITKEKDNIPQQTGSRTRWLMLGCAWLVSFCIFAAILCVPPMEHIIKEQFLLTHEQMGLIFSLPILVMAVGAIPGGLLADRIGIRKAAGIGAIAMVMGSLARGTASSYEALAAFSALLGVGIALVYPNMPKLVGAWFPREQTGLATGIYITGMGVGSSLGLAITLPVVFPITNTFQGTFYVWSIPVIVAAILWWAIVRESPRSSIQGQQVQVGKASKVSSSLVWKNRNLWLVAISMFAIVFHFYVWTGWTPALAMLKGAPPDLAALIASVVTWVSIPSIMLLPWFSDKLGLRRPFFWISSIMLICASLAAIYASLPFLWGIMVVVGIVMAMPALLLTLPIEMVPKESVGTASGMVISIGYLGGLAGPSVAGRILDITGTLDQAMIVLIGLAIIPLVIGFLLPEVGAKGTLLK